MSNVTKVIIYLGDGSTIEINKPVVARMRIQGLSIYQVQASDSDVKVVKPQPTVPQPRPSLIIQQPQQTTASKAPPQQYEPSEDDIKLVMEETGCTRRRLSRRLRKLMGTLRRQ